MTFYCSSLFVGIDFQTMSKTKIVQVKILYLFIICYMVCYINLAQPPSKKKKKIKKTEMTPLIEITNMFDVNT